MPKPLKKQKKIKAWMFRGSDGYFAAYPEKEEAEFFADYLYPRKKPKIIPCTITYTP
jgi:hypothetical protein